MRPGTQAHGVNERDRPAVPSGTPASRPASDVRRPVDRHAGPVFQGPARACAGLGRQLGGLGPEAGAIDRRRPAAGWPIWARWTRIWWVRPVSSRQAIRLATGLPSVAGIALQHLPMGDGLAAAARAPPSCRGACGWRSIGASIVPLGAVGRAPDERQIAALAAAPVRPWSANCAASALVRAVGLGHHHQAGGVLVEPVHDAGPLARRRCPTGCRRNGRSAH